MTISTCRANARSQGIFAFATLGPSGWPSIRRDGDSQIQTSLSLLEQASNRAPKKNHSNMDGHRSSSACSPCPKPGDWGECSVSHSRLVKLQTQGLLPPAFIVPVRAGVATYDCGEQAERSPNPSPEERICLIPHLLRGVEFPIHPFLRGLLKFYGLQLHNFTPASVLHIVGYVTLCELFLGCEAHFGLWKKLFCLVPRNQGESLC